jgi:hypothetical protein
MDIVLYKLYKDWELPFHFYALLFPLIVALFLFY